MKKLVILGLLVFGITELWKDFNVKKDPIFSTPYVAVYGRDNCGYTQKMISDLRKSGLNFRYFTVDNRSTADQLHSRMESAGISTRRYNLPVVDTNGLLSVRPDFSDVIDEYNNGI